MLNAISSILFGGLAISFALAAYQDLKTREVYLATWIPAVLGIAGYLILIGSIWFVMIEMIFAVTVFMVCYAIYSIKNSKGHHKIEMGDVTAITLIAFAPVAMLITVFVALVLSFKFRDPKTHYSPFVGVLGITVVIFSAVMALVPFYFL